MGLSAIVSVVVTFGLLGYAIVRALARVVPFKPLQDALTRISLDSFLTTWWGDVYVLLDDPVQAANIRGQIAKTIQALRAFGCRRIVVVAHSGGTIVSYMALSDPALSEAADTLVTHGQAIQMGRMIHRAEGSIQTSPGVRIDRGLPLRIARWRDFHATHDPAPAGQLEEANPATPPAPGIVFQDTEVWNRMSIAEDHGEYISKRRGVRRRAPLRDRDGRPAGSAVPLRAGPQGTHRTAAAARVHPRALEAAHVRHPADGDHDGVPHAFRGLIPSCAMPPAQSLSSYPARPS